jgi:hypothetical protein
MIKSNILQYTWLYIEIVEDNKKNKKLVKGFKILIVDSLIKEFKVGPQFIPQLFCPCQRIYESNSRAKLDALPNPGHCMKNPQK